jgi:hypothetical protein
MPITVETFLSNPLQPAAYPQDAREEAVKLGASLTLAKGTVLAKKTSDSLFYAYANPNRVQTPAIAGTLSAGGYRLGIVDKNGVKQVTPLIAYNAVTADVQTAVNAVIPQETAVNQIVVGGTAHTAQTFTFSGVSYDATVQPIIEVYPDGLTGMETASVDDTTTTTGLETPSCLLIHAVKTDAAGRVYYSDSAVESSDNRSYAVAQVYVAGVFKTSDLTGWDADALAAFKARALPSGFVRIP